jgi:hypothetical protein
VKICKIRVICVQLKEYFRWGQLWVILQKGGLKGKPGVDKLKLFDLRHIASTDLTKEGKDIEYSGT